jgi:anti-sigma factor RsiW
MTIMDREQASDMFSAYREGELPPDQVRSLEKFLEQDKECRSDYERFCRTLDTLAMLREQPAPDGFVEKLQGRIRRRSGGKLFSSGPGSMLTRVPYELFSLVLILILLAVYLLSMPVILNIQRSGAEGSGQPRTTQPEGP